MNTTKERSTACVTCTMNQWACYWIDILISSINAIKSA